MTAPRPKLDIFNDSPCLLSKKCRTSTPSLRPPKPPTKSSKHFRRQRGYHLEHRQSHTLHNFNLSNNNNENILNLNENPFQFHFNLGDDSFLAQPTPHQPQAQFQPQFHDGSFSFGHLDQAQNADDECSKYCRLYQKFEIICKIGSGYFADVYKAKSLEDGKYYAIKKTSKPYTSESDRSRKLQEVENHQSLPPHPNCVRYYDSWEEDGFLYIQTELCETSLNGVLETYKDHKLPEGVVWKYLIDLLSAVKHLHDHDLLHLDIKPDNIFISFDGVAKLGDFGLMCSCLDLNSSAISSMSTNVPQTIPPTSRGGAGLNKRADTKETINSSTITTTINASTTTTDHIMNDEFDDSFIIHHTIDHDDSGIINRSDESIDSIDEGDSKYLASETMQGKFTKAADIFSLGITIFEVASGLDLPQRGEIYHKLRHNEIEDLYFNGLSSDLVRVIKMMMEEDYTKRPTIDDLLELVATLRSKRLDASSPNITIDNSV